MENNLTIQKLNDKIEGLKKYFKEFNFGEYSKQDEVKKLNELQNKLYDKKYKIGIVANMSAGKSTFINALFGTDILPTFNQATTDCATYVYSTGEKKSIIYKDNEKIELEENELEEIKKYALKDSSEELKGSENDKYKNVTKIDLYYPFKYIQNSKQDDLNVIFIDTPGPNNTGIEKEKHEWITYSVINDVDMLFVIFDFGQLDANLTEGLWNSIKERIEKSGEFKVYFLINKIDMALTDNFPKGENEKLVKENWFKKEKEAVKTLEEAILKHKIEKNKIEIFPVSSEYQLLQRGKHFNKRDKRVLLALEEDIEEIFPDKNSEEILLDYLGFEKLEKSINEFINNVAKKNLLDGIDSEIDNIVVEEQKFLYGNKQILEGDKKKENERLEEASNFLEKDAKELEKNLNEEISEEVKKSKREIKELIDSRIEKDFRNKREEIIFRIMYYPFLYGSLFDFDKTKKIIEGYSVSNLKDFFEKDILEKSSYSREIKKHLTDEEKEKLNKEVSNYTYEKINECKYSYLGISSDIKEFYHNFDKRVTKLFFKYKDKLEEYIDDILEIKKENININVDISYVRDIEFTIPKSQVDYKFEDAKYESAFVWYKPWTFFYDDIKVGDEKKYITINPKDNYSNIDKTIETFIKSFYEKEINQHNEIIGNNLNSIKDLYQNFRHKKDNEIELSKRALNNQEENLKLVKKEIENFNKIIEEK